MNGDAAGYIGSIPQHYDRSLGPLIFADYAADIPHRVIACNPARVLERDSKLPGAALRVAILLWQYQNDERGCALPSVECIAADLNMHKSTVVRSLQVLHKREWITVRHRGGRHRTNEYRIAFGSMDDEEKL